MIDPARHHTTTQLEAERSAMVRTDRAARAAFTDSLDEVAARLEHAARILRRLTGEPHVPVTDRAEWAEQELRVLAQHLKPGTLTHLARGCERVVYDIERLDTRLDPD